MSGRHRASTTRRRLDAELVRRGLANSREQARAHIVAGRVTVGGAPAATPARMVAASEAVHVSGPPARFVSRGGDKLDAALERFRVPVRGTRALDAGASTGGFTDCLLQRGASIVFAVDVGHGQLHPRVRDDERVVARERTNARHLTLDDVGSVPVDVVVADLSFISLGTVLPALVGLCSREGDLVLLAKPQFEAGRAAVSKGKGVVREPEVWREVLTNVRAALARHGAAMMDAMVSPLTGADGNVEFLLHARLRDGDVDAPGRVVDLGAVVDEASARHGVGVR